MLVSGFLPSPDSGPFNTLLFHTNIGYCTRIYIHRIILKGETILLLHMLMRTLRERTEQVCIRSAQACSQLLSYSSSYLLNDCVKLLRNIDTNPERAFV
jgi:hypothetical protein